ncbi:hypothetical protein H8K20_10825 [Neobittarella massiliensis]|uniref:Uncharacterized protein n=1 Tax=Neobittarella massiliensis (ex Bilen et al. 2018) TaxID=2041842 RepID=A0A8J6LUM8_9FIRM|nr:hypothetical protein [Neobittarella massiliensis]MBC3516889.1 hypothetical protein [Neobittarella massiliensis]
MSYIEISKRFVDILLDEYRREYGEEPSDINKQLFLSCSRWAAQAYSEGFTDGMNAAHNTITAQGGQVK